MNFKLKGIEIDAFRVYQDKQLFNFITKSGEVANLVVIFAPNGYGKTSFIDAVEWALTGDINRISKNTVVKYTAESEKGVILKNRKSKKEYGTVTLIAENGGSLEKNTKIIGKSGRKTDYADGDIVVKSDIFEDLNFEEFTTKSILGQDKIDSFLRSFSPKERYNTLTNFWDHANDSELFKSILGMNVESEKQIKQIKDQLLELGTEIQNLIIRPDIISKINRLVDYFNQIKIIEFKLPSLDLNNNQQFVNSLIEVNTKVSSLYDEINNKLLNSGYLVQSYLSFSLKNNELNETRVKIRELTIILNKFKEREEKTTSQKLVMVEFYYLHKKYKNIKKLKKQFNEYQNINNKIKDYEGLNRGLTKEISNLTSLKTQEEQNNKFIQNELRKVQKSKDYLESNFSKLDNNLENYHILENKKTHKNKRLLQIQELNNYRLRNVNEYKKKILTLESYLKYDIQNIIKVHSKKLAIKSLISELTIRYYAKIQKEQELKRLDKEYIQFGELNEQLNTIYKVGRKLIEESQLNSCPLCKKDYEDFNTLLNNVDKEFLDVNSLNKIKSDIEDIEKEIKDEEDKIEQLITLFSLKVQNEVLILSKKVIDNESKLTSNNSLSQKIQNRLHLIKIEENNLINFFNELNVSIENINLVYLSNVKTSILEEIKRLSNSIKKYNLNLNENSEIQKDLIREMNKKEVEIVSNKNNIRELSEDPILDEVNRLFEELKIDKNINKIKNEYEEVRQEYLLLIKNMRVITEQINNLNLVLEAYNKQEIANSLEKGQKGHQELQEYIENYKKILNKLNLGNTYEKEDITKINNGLIIVKNDVKAGLTHLNELMGFTNYIEDNIASKTKESKKRELEEELKLLEKGNAELSSAKQSLTQYIEAKINNTFNLESINSIYQRIDPHPDFNNIKFDADFTKDKPELHIYASSQQETLAPILYFSAAQVNILSLSIFLAKALIKEQEGLNTIFMDDPIQHLDNLNILSFIDLLRTITINLDKQVIISTHNENFYKLIKRKMDPEYTSSKFIELESFGKLKNN
jgi:DNA repair protein SbcC/Rad50